MTTHVLLLLFVFFTGSSGHSWPAFALGAIVGIIIFFVVPRLRKRKER
jgi:multisubunit Na+/H+ antiporter MnhE subunit